MSGRADNSNTSKVTGLESSKADGNTPARKDGERKLQNKHGKKLVGSNVDKANTGKANAACSKKSIGEISKDNTDATLAKSRPKRRASAPVR